MDLVQWSSMETGLPVIGVDEAGRGCLCGPVYAAAVIFNSEAEKGFYKDSKLLSEKKREELYEQILATHKVGVGFATAKEIDQVNILQATFLAMKRAIAGLSGVTKAHVMIDGNQLLPQFQSFPQSAIIKGDQKVPEISAASIVAKVSRDRYLKKISATYPEYEFSKHKGYGTAVHKKLIEKYGPCQEHRLTFKGVREFYKSSAQ